MQGVYDRRSSVRRRQHLQSCNGMSKYYDDLWDAKSYFGYKVKELNASSKVPEPPDLYGKAQAEGVVQGLLDYIPNTRDLNRDSEILENLRAIICNLIDSSDAYRILPIEMLLRNCSFHCAKKSTALVQETMRMFKDKEKAPPTRVREPCKFPSICGGCGECVTTNSSAASEDEEKAQPTEVSEPCDCSSCVEYYNLLRQATRNKEKAPITKVTEPSEYCDCIDSLGECCNRCAGT